jgi:hypothetical protein
MPFAILLAALLIPALAVDAAAGQPFLATNDDNSARYPTSAASFYPIAANGMLLSPATGDSGGNGIAGGYFGSQRVVVAPGGESACVYVSEAQDQKIAGIDAVTHRRAGPFTGAPDDIRLALDGVGLAVSADYLYASFTASRNIGTFRMEAGCALRFEGGVHAQGLNGGSMESMAIHGHMLVAAYGDGSIESFDIAGGKPVSHGDAQLSTGAADAHLPDAVDITRDGRYAIFGDASSVTTVEVSDISSGKLTPTVVYGLGTAWNSGSIRLSPDESVLYVSNSSGGRVTAAFFDKATGKARKGCMSPPLKGFYTKFAYAGGIATQLPTGTGGLIYVAEFGMHGMSYIGMLRFTSTRTGCRLTEPRDSPVAGAPSSALLSIAVYPSRPF